MNRRQFLRLSATSALLAGCQPQRLSSLPPWLPVSMLKVGMAEGHWLRGLKKLPPVQGQRRTKTVIIGSGIAGLTAAWRLQQAGYHDFILLKGPEPLGNASGGQWLDVPYPRGAHYLPLPNVDLQPVRELLQAFAVIEADPFALQPRYDERAVLQALDERSLVGNEWQDGLVAALKHGSAQQQYQRFSQYVQGLRGQRGRDGRVLFTIPLVLSSQDAEWRALDQIHFATWLQQHGYTDPALLWYLNYCCRDDYGRNSHEVSAWAGLHYFTSRYGVGQNIVDDGLLTWPNGLQHLALQLASASQTQHLDGFALRIQEQTNGVVVTYAERVAGRIVEIQADQVICATPLQVTAHLLPQLADYGFDPQTDMPSHAPWLVTNVYFDGFPNELAGTELAWDNVVYGSQSLGYVVATHQWLRAAKPPHTVFTAYHALAEKTPQAGRKWLQQANAEELLAVALTDIEQAYGWSELWRCARGVEVVVRGHAMATPNVGYLQQKGLLALRNADGRVLFAHSDLSSYSIFEEAVWWGWQAAEKIIGR